MTGADNPFSGITQAFEVFLSEEDEGVRNNLRSVGLLADIKGVGESLARLRELEPRVRMDLQLKDIIVDKHGTVFVPLDGVDHPEFNVEILLDSEAELYALDPDTRRLLLTQVL